MPNGYRRGLAYPVGLALMLIALGANAPLSATSKELEGTFHLIYHAIASTVELGARVKLEPALLTDGDRLVFAYDYCRQQFPTQNYSPGHNRHEQHVDPRDVVAIDRSVLEHYCQRKQFTLKNGELLGLDNAGLAVELSDITYEPQPLAGNQQWAPEPFTASIAAIQGRVTEKLPAARARGQPYAFLLSRDRSLLERVIVQTRTNPADAAPLVARHNQYLSRRKAMTREAIAKEECHARLHPPSTKYPDWRNWLARAGSAPATVELVYADIDRDGRIDLLVQIVEDRERLNMIRIYFGNGREHCAFRNHESSPRPHIMVNTRRCVYASYFVLGDSNSRHTLVLLYGSPDMCRVRSSVRWHERL